MAGLHSLPLFHRIAGTKIVVVGAGAEAAAKRRLVERAGGVCCGEEASDEAFFAFVALEDGAAAEDTAERLRGRGLAVNVADRPELCDFTLPSILERGDVLVAVSTGGASAGLAKHLRLRLEALLPPTLAALASGLSAARERIRARWPDAGSRRHAIDAALAEGGPLDPFDADAPARLDEWIAGEGTADLDRTVEIVLASDDPDDLTLRQARLLGMADTIVHPAGISPAVLARARADAVFLGEPSGDGRPGLTLILHRRVSTK